MADNCFTQIQACLLVVCRLDDAGFVIAGTDDDLVISDALVTLGYSTVIKEGANVSKDNGCGGECASYQAPDKITGVNLTLEVCTLDFELMALLTGAGLINEGGRGIVGSMLPASDAPLTSRVGVMAYAQAWDGDAQATEGGDPLYVRYIFPSTSWVEGDRQMVGEDFAQITLGGRGRGNPNFLDGPLNDLPVEAWTAKNEYLDNNALPEATCGYSASIAS